MAKTGKEQLGKYKKANKADREKIVKKAGFSSEAAYLADLYLKISKEEDLVVEDPKEEEDAPLDQVIAFDTTGSMYSYLDAVKKHVIDLIPKLFAENKELRIKIVAFGDYCDMRSKDIFGNAYQESKMTNDINYLIDFVKNAQKTSGGDSDEFYELVIKKIIEETDWREGARKAALLIADSDPHLLGYTHGNKVVNNQIDWREEAKKSATKGISWDTLTCIPTYVDTFYKPLSQITGGICIPFKSSEKTQEVVYAVTSARGGMKSKKAFRTALAKAEASGDTELIGSYKSLSSLL